MSVLVCGNRHLMLPSGNPPRFVDSQELQMGVFLQVSVRIYSPSTNKQSMVKRWCRNASHHLTTVVFRTTLTRTTTTTTTIIIIIIIIIIIKIILIITNHKNYNFLACDWFKKVLFSTNPLAKLLFDSLLLDSLLSDSSISQSHSKM